MKIKEAYAMMEKNGSLCNANILHSIVVFRMLQNAENKKK